MNLAGRMRGVDRDYEYEKTKRGKVNAESPEGVFIGFSSCVCFTGFQPVFNRFSQLSLFAPRLFDPAVGLLMSVAGLENGNRKRGARKRLHLSH